LPFFLDSEHDDRPVVAKKSVFSRAIPSVSKIKTETNAQSFYTQPSTNRKRRRRFTVADVISAMDNGEFTGYELLQIVKAAVPKL